MTTLDDEISTAFGLLGLLLVFVIRYFAALFPLHRISSSARRPMSRPTAER
jgi:hypothetical protein